MIHLKPTEVPWKIESTLLPKVVLYEDIKIELTVTFQESSKDHFVTMEFNSSIFFMQTPSYNEGQSLNPSIFQIESVLSHVSNPGQWLFDYSNVWKNTGNCPLPNIYCTLVDDDVLGYYRINLLKNDTYNLYIITLKEMCYHIIAKKFNWKMS